MRRGPLEQNHPMKIIYVQLSKDTDVKGSAVGSWIEFLNASE